MCQNLHWKRNRFIAVRRLAIHYFLLLLLLLLLLILLLYIVCYKSFRRRGVGGRVHDFLPGGPGSILGGVRNFNFWPGIGCVSFVWILSCVVSGGDPDIELTTHSGKAALVCLSSVLVQRVLLPLQASYPRAFGLLVPGVGCKS